jgi:hypothetical protein
MLHNGVNDVQLSTKKTSQRGARLEVPGACNGLSARNGLSADCGKLQQAAPRALATFIVDHSAAEPSEAPPGLRPKPGGARASPPEEITIPVERACLLEVFLSPQKLLHCATDAMLVGRKIPPWPKDAVVFVDDARVQVGEDVNVIARPVMPVQHYSCSNVA